ncbi:MAG: hypothetical protein ACN6OD_21100 [Alcaligenes sp.]
MVNTALYWQPAPDMQGAPATNFSVSGFGSRWSVLQPRCAPGPGVLSDRQQSLRLFLVLFLRRPGRRGFILVLFLDLSKHVSFREPFSIRLCCPACSGRSTCARRVRDQRATKKPARDGWLL